MPLRPHSYMNTCLEAYTSTLNELGGRGESHKVRGRFETSLAALASATVREIAHRPIGQVGLPAPWPLMDCDLTRGSYDLDPWNWKPEAIATVLLGHLPWPAKLSFAVPLATGVPDAEGVFFYDRAVLRVIVAGPFTTFDINTIASLIS